MNRSITYHLSVFSRKLKGCTDKHLWLLGIALVLLIPALAAAVFQVNKMIRMNDHRKIANAAACLLDEGDAFMARRLLTEVVSEGDWTTSNEEPEAAWTLLRAMDATEGRIHLPEPLTDMVVSDSATIFTLSYSVPLRREILREWDPETGVMVRELSYDVQTTLANGYERVFVFSPDGSRILSECGTVFDTGTFSRVLEMEGGPHWLSVISFSPDGRVVAAREQGDLTVWDAGTGRRIARIVDAFVYQRHILREYSTIFSPDGRYLAFSPGHRGVGIVRLDGSDDVTVLPATDSVRLWNVREYDPGKVPEGSRLLGFSSDSRTLLTRDEGNGIRAWDLLSGKQVTVPGDVSDSLSAPPGGNGPARQVDDNTLAVTLSPQERLPSMIQSPIPPDEGSYDGLWGEGIILKAVSSNGRFQAFTKVKDADDISLHIVNVLTEDVVSAGSLSKTYRLEFCSEGRLLLAFNPEGGPMILFDTETGRKAAEWVHSGCKGYVFCDKRKLIGTFDGTNLIRIWDYDGRMRGSFELDRGDSAINAISFSPSGKMLACAGTNGALVLWDVASGRERVFQGLAEDVKDVCFSRDGTLMATLSDDGMVRIWSPSTGRLYWQVQFPGQSGLEELRFSLSGTALFATSPRQEIWRWDLPNFRLLARKLWIEYGGHPLSKEEKKRLVHQTGF